MMWMLFLRKGAICDVLSVTITYRPLCLLQHRYIFEFVYTCAEYFLGLYKYVPYLFRKLWGGNFLAQHISNAKRPYVMTFGHHYIWPPLPSVCKKCIT